jgi:hypothetical protein
MFYIFQVINSDAMKALYSGLTMKKLTVSVFSILIITTGCFTQSIAYSEELFTKLEISADENKKSESSVAENDQNVKPVYLIDNSKNSDTYIQSYTRNTNCKVVRVNYYQTSRVSVWIKLRKLFRKKSSPVKRMNMKTIAAVYTTDVGEY